MSNLHRLKLLYCKISRRYKVGYGLRNLPGSYHFIANESQVHKVNIHQRIEVMFEEWSVECHQETGQPVETLIPSVPDLTSSCQEVSKQWLISIIFESG